mgnify:CR=1 FL=1
MRAGLLFKKRFFVTIASIFVLDIVTKQYALRGLIEGASYEFLPFIDLYLTFNSGVAFGFLDIGNRVISNILTLIGILIVIYVFKLIKNEGEVVFYYEITAPKELAPGKDLTISGKAGWQICDEGSCVQESGEISLVIKSAAASVPKMGVSSWLC